ncbi:MAG: rod-binding protein [Roseobacter sp.]
MPSIQHVSHTPVAMSKNDQALLKVAQKLEASFLSEMLKAAGLGKTSGPFNGGAGEDQFASFLVDEQAKQIVQTGGLGLAESIFDSLKESQDAK